MRIQTTIFLFALVALVGCASAVPVPANTADSGTDANLEVDGTVVGFDSGTDAGAGNDSGIDSGVNTGVDAGVDAGAGSDGGMCGNAFLDLGEQCDDGNLVDTDVCRNNCTFTPICGDGVLNMASGEQCDDGNNRSADGCSGQCKLEVCGNAILDVGEVCDGTPGCAADCHSVTTCGNGIIDGSDQCDDANTTSWDGCSAACLVERASVLSDIALLTSGGCDYTGDGIGESSLGSNFQDVLTFVAPLISQSLQMSPFQTLAYQGVEDALLATDDPSVRIAWLQGTDANGAAADFDGSGQVRIAAASLLNGQPRLSLPGSIASHVLNAGPEDITLPFLMGINIGLSRARIVDTTITVAPNGGNPRYSVAALSGTLCGIAQVRGFASIPNFLALAGMNLPIQVPTTSCDTTAVPTAQVNMADVLVGGASAAGGFFTLIYGIGPDVDVDGDGLESYTVVSGPNCQAVITGCVDGDGTVIPGHACITDSRMQDGWSSAFHFTAASTTIIP